MPDGRRRSREGWADTMEAGPAHPPAHTHRLPKVVRFALVMLVFAQILTLAGLGISMVYNYQQQQYIDGRGEFRDRENTRMKAENEERTRQAMCDLLDQFPEGGWLERPRVKYGCGPGIPLEELTPEEQARLSGRGRASVQPSAEATPPAATFTPGPTRDDVDPPPMAWPPETAPEAPAEQSSAEPEPGPLDPVTDTACGVVGACP